MRRAILMFPFIVAAVLPGQAIARAEWTVVGAGWAVLSGILSYEGAKAWRRFQHIPNEEELQRQTVIQMAAILGEHLAEQRLGQARSYFLNATRELQYYINNPTENRNSLDEARTQSGYALNEFSQMGPQSLELYCLCAILHMAILQEKLKTSQNVDAEKRNIELHISEAKRFLQFAEEKIARHFHWAPNTLYRPPPEFPIIIPGTLAIDIPDPKEDRARRGVEAARLVVKAFEDPRGAFPLVRSRINGLQQAGRINIDNIRTLPVEPVNTGSLAIGYPRNAGQRGIGQVL